MLIMVLVFGTTIYRCGSCGSYVYGQSTDPRMEFSDFPITNLQRCEKGYLLACPGPQVADKNHAPLLKPTIHINYTMRIQDMKDGLTKFEGMPGPDPIIMPE
jgi:hypothetical protein